MAFIDKSIIDEIKSKNDIVDVIGSYISLNDKNKALCPFHDDHSPFDTLKSIYSLNPSLFISSFALFITLILISLAIDFILVLASIIPSFA